MPARPRFSRAFRLAGALSFACAVFALPLQAQQWMAQLSGAAEESPNNSPATGVFHFSLVGNVFNIQGSFSGLTTNTAAAHIHCCTAVANTGLAAVTIMPGLLTGFPSGVTSGSMNQDFNWNDPAIFRAGFISESGGSLALAQDRLLTGLTNGTAYFNIHTTDFPGGEIRGFITPTSTVPEPSTYALMGAGLLALVVVQRRRGATAG